MQAITLVLYPALGLSSVMCVTCHVCHLSHPYDTHSHSPIPSPDFLMALNSEIHLAVGFPSILTVRGFIPDLSILSSGVYQPDGLCEDL